MADPLTPNSTYHFRAVAIGDGTSYGQARVFQTKPLPTITLVSPNGGESWVGGTSHVIIWTYEGAGKNVRIDLIKDGVLGEVLSYSAPIGIGGNGYFNWVIPATQAGTDYKVRINSISNSIGTDTSDDAFTITKQ